ncbi:hypothetical protein [Granulicoccus phenolivorans]|uniref:hypothetical protein n=1 Tax=Granulicoccus phenolivorans TaxID=266854 RepID=UPI00047DE2F2|nr:hypothetical protein [Granulicoccus phenolivorans]
MNKPWRVLGRLWPVGVVAGIAIPVFARAPRPEPVTPDGVRTIEDAVTESRGSGLSGWALVDHVQQLTHRKFASYSILTPWESPAVAFRNSRGNPNQYNGALNEILNRLGLQTELVFASRVRSQNRPWWRVGHVWVRVRIDRVTRDVDAGTVDGGAGKVDFVPLTQVRRFRRLTYLNTSVVWSLLAAYQVWRSILLRQPLPAWTHHPLGQPVAE